ncbi:Hypothetical_protein [Hexamita inflata]|uniref:Hypothetical_protein n=1 Tax=Hexamita inflata TaxID=28002 RepID=A0AA86N650_9EUKA|nr:Hypothetical protein HINF_LOCUS1195 [Hexamita inflata]
MIRSNFSIQGDYWQLVYFYFIINLEFGVDFRDQLQLSSLPSVFYQQDVLESQICYCRTRNLKNTAQSDPSKFYAGGKVEIDVDEYTMAQQQITSFVGTHRYLLFRTTVFQFNLQLYWVNFEFVKHTSDIHFSDILLSNTFSRASVISVEVITAKKQRD